MPIAAQAASSVDVFNGAREELERMIGKLREGGARAHTEVIGELRKGGAEVQRRLLQGWLDRLLAAIPHDDVAVQWDVAVEFGVLEESFVPGGAQATVPEPLGGGFQQAAGLGGGGRRSWP